MTDERYNEIKSEMDRLFSLDRSTKTVNELFNTFFDSPSADAYFGALSTSEQEQYRVRRRDEDESTYGVDPAPELY